MRAIAISALTALVTLASVAVSHDMPYAQAQPGRPNPSTGFSFSSTDCGTGNNLVLNMSIGGVCFGSLPQDGWDENCFCDPCDFPDVGCIPEAPGPQHLTDAPTATLTIDDAVFSLVPGVYCQNLNRNHDNLCGGNLTGPPETEPGGNQSPLCQVPHREGAAGCSFRSEPSVEFCDSITIYQGLNGSLPQGTRREGGVYPGTAGSGDWADPTLPNWDISESVFLFLSGPLNGNPLTWNPCGNLGWATTGSVSHT